MEHPQTLEEIYRHPTTIHGGFAVRRIPGQGAGEIHADGNISTDGSLQASGAVVDGACEFGAPTCPTTIRGPLVLEGPITAPALSPADSVELLLAPNQWTPVPPVAPGRLALVLVETPATSAAFFAAPGLVSTAFREMAPPHHIALRGGPDAPGLEIALLYDDRRDGEAAGSSGIAGAIREVPAGKEKDDASRDTPGASGPCGGGPAGAAVRARLRFLSAAGGAISSRG